ncbi:hypothetical protein BpHYR1_024166 [Brachionus plicatilis]|uniref:Uncharacterized protein n=1 Tax=Brachionus plicatilis TaxID=10195 RepID=A0A3M7T668_BRAPC|nr:hypothetical protein BpHYR1_024166 [Brachionus plicatilis]
MSYEIRVIFPIVPSFFKYHQSSERTVKKLYSRAKLRDSLRLIPKKKEIYTNRILFFINKIFWKIKLEMPAKIHNFLKLTLVSLTINYIMLQLNHYYFFYYYYNYYVIGYPRRAL